MSSPRLGECAPAPSRSPPPAWRPGANRGADRYRCRRVMPPARDHHAATPSSNAPGSLAFSRVLSNGRGSVPAVTASNWDLPPRVRVNAKPPPGKGKAPLACFGTGVSEMMFPAAQYSAPRIRTRFGPCKWTPEAASQARGVAPNGSGNTARCRREPSRAAPPAASSSRFHMVKAVRPCAETATDIWSRREARVCKFLRCR